MCMRVRMRIISRRKPKTPHYRRSIAKKHERENSRRDVESEREKCIENV